MGMNKEDINTWLKASAENKITTKNTWKSTLITHFKDISQFREDRGVNFQKASSTLEGCMKVYGTRVDDVSEHTLKLLEMFGKEEPKKKKKRSFLEKNLNNINLSVSNEGVFYDTKFQYILLEEERFLCDILNGSILEGSERGIILTDVKERVEIENLPICSKAVTFELGGDNDLYEGNENNDLDMDNENNDLYENNDIDEGNDLYEGNDIDDNDMDRIAEESNTRGFIYAENPFGYFKGWKGQSTWKVEEKDTKEKKRKERKEREKYFLDFEEHCDLNILFESVDATMTKESILERRKNRNVLPEDYSYEMRDLYRFIIGDGYFTSKHDCVTGASSVGGVRDGSNASASDGNELHGNELHVSELGASEMDDPGTMEDNNAGTMEDNDLSMQLERSLILEDNVKTTDTGKKPQKKVDISKLKGNISKILSTEKMSIKQIHNEVTKIYPKKEAKDISVHFCLISLLHLANEGVISILKGDPLWFSKSVVN